ALVRRSASKPKTAPISAKPEITPQFCSHLFPVSNQPPSHHGGFFEPSSNHFQKNPPTYATIKPFMGLHAACPCLACSPPPPYLLGTCRNGVPPSAPVPTTLFLLTRKKT